MGHVVGGRRVVQPQVNVNAVGRRVEARHAGHRQRKVHALVALRELGQEVAVQVQPVRAHAQPAADRGGGRIAR